MQDHRASRTAAAIATVRAAHLRYEQPVVFADRYALALTSPGWRAIVRSPLLRRLVFLTLLAPMRPVGAQILVRARYCEDELERALARGIGQYVIIGAGLDSFALRRADLGERLRVYEVDHPATQAAKQAAVARIAATPPNLEYVAVDFERGTVADALARSSFERRDPAFFSWLGTTHYLTPEAVFATLGAVAGLAAPDSRIVFDYTVRPHALDAAERREFESTSRFVARRGEPFRSHFEPASLLAAVGALGLTLVEDLDATEQRRRYFADRQDGLRPTALTHLAHFEVAGAEAMDGRATARPAG